MTTKEELLNKTNSIQNQLNEVLEQLKNLPKEETCERWRAEEGKHYFFIDSTGAICQGTDWRMYYDNYRHASGNYFRTREGAAEDKENHLTKQQLKDLAMRLNKKSDYKGQEFGICFKAGKIGYSWAASVKHLGQVYCFDSNFFDIAKQEIGEEKLIKLIESGV